VKFKVKEYDFPTGAPVWFMRTTMKLDGEKAWLNVKRALEMTKATVLLIDSISNFWNVQDENSNAEVSTWLARIMDLAEKGGITVLLIYHHGQRGGASRVAGQAMRGATAFFQCVDQGIDIFDSSDPLNEPDERVVKIKGRFDESPEQLRYILKDSEFEDVPLSTGNEDRLEVLRKAMSQEWMGLDTLAKTARLGLKTLRQVLTPLPTGFETRGTGVKGDPRLYRLRGVN
jgi:hypothetical protein